MWTSNEFTAWEYTYALQVGRKPEENDERQEQEEPDRGCGVRGGARDARSGRERAAACGRGAGEKRRESAALRSRSDVAEAAAESLAARQRHRRRRRQGRSRLHHPPRRGDARP